MNENASYGRNLALLDDREKVRLLQELEAERARSHARSVQVLVALHAGPAMTAEQARAGVETLSPDDMTRMEVAGALRLTDYYARQHVEVALALARRMPATMAVLVAGDLTYDRAEVIARQAIPLAEYTFQEARRQGMSPREAEAAACAVIARVEEIVLAEAPDQTRGQVAHRVGKAVATVAPEFVEERRRAAVRGRDVQHPAKSAADPDGQDMRALFAHLPAPEAQAAWTTIDAYARAMRAEGDERTLEELRADTLTHLILRGSPPTEKQIAGPNSSFTAEPGSCPDDRPATAPMDWERVAGFDRYGLRANVEVVVSLETLMGVSDAPGHLAGHGAISAQVARDIAFKAGGVWRRLVTDERGTVIDRSSTRYVPPEPLKQFIRARDRVCRTPWCDRPAGTCDIDHVRAWPAGATEAGNLQAKCRRCHRSKHEGGWRHEVLKDGTIRIVSPTGMEYLSEVPDLRPLSGRPLSAR